MRTGDDGDTPLSSSRLQELLIGVLAAIVVIAAVLPWLALVNAWQTVGRDGFFPEPALEAMPRLVLAVQSLPYLSLQSGNHDVLAMVAASGVILLSRGRPAESHDGMRWSPALVATGAAVVVALLAALVRLLVSAYTQLGPVDEWVDEYFVPSSGTGAVLGVLAPAVPVLGWVAVLVAGALYRPGSGIGEEAADDESEPVEEPTGRRRGRTSEEHLEAPAGPVGPADIRVDGASDSGYDEFRFRR